MENNCESALKSILRDGKYYDHRHDSFLFDVERSSQTRLLSELLTRAASEADKTFSVLPAAKQRIHSQRIGSINEIASLVARISKQERITPETFNLACEEADFALIKMDRIPSIRTDKGPDDLSVFLSKYRKKR